MKRVRNVKSRRVHICFHHCHLAALPTTPEEIHAYILRTLNSSQIEYDPQYLIDWKPSPDDFKSVRKVKRDAYYDTIVYLIAQANESKNDFADRFLALGVENQGWLPKQIIKMDQEYCRVHGLTEETMAADNKALRESKKTATNKQHREIAGSRDLSVHEATYLERKLEQHEFLERHERVELKKYKFAQFYGINRPTPTITSNYYAKYQSKKTIHAYRNQCFAFQYGPNNAAILKYLHETEKKLLSLENARSEEDDEFTFTVLTTQRRFDKFRYALSIITKLGFRHIWDSPDFQGNDEFTTLSKTALEKTLCIIFPHLWNEIRDYAGKPIFVVADEQPLGNHATNDIANYFPQNIHTSEWKKKNYKRNIDYMMMLYDLRRKDLFDWSPETVPSFTSILGLTNSILKFAFGIKLSPLSSSKRDCYVLKHCFHFRNSKFPSCSTKKGDDIPLADWPSLDRRHLMVSTIQEDELTEPHETGSHRLIDSTIAMESLPFSLAHLESPPQSINAEKRGNCRDILQVVDADNPISLAGSLDVNHKQTMVSGFASCEQQEGTRNQRCTKKEI